MERKLRFVVQEFSGAVLGHDGLFTDYISDALHFVQEYQAIEASHRWIGSRVVPIFLHSPDFEHENLIEDDRFIHTAYVSLWN